MTTYPKTSRLKKTFQYRKVQDQGAHHKGRYLVLCFRQDGALRPPKLGVVASRHYGSAIERNRFKRLTREAFRHLYPDLPKGAELVIKPRKQALVASMKEILQELNDLITQELNKQSS